MATYYWVGGTGTWDTTTTTNWSATTGGAGGAGVPGLADVAIIDTSSGTGTITCTGGRCATLTVTATQAITLGATSSTLTVTSDLTFPTGNSFAVAASLTLTLGGATVGSGLTGARTFTTGGKTLGILVIDGLATQSWTLTGALTCANGITLNSGTFNTAGFAVSCSSFTIAPSSVVKTLTLGASTITCSSTWTVNSTGFLTFNANTSTISLSSSVNFQFTGGGLNYNNVTFTTTAANTTTIAGSNSFNNLTFASPSTGIKAVSFSANQVITGTLTCNGATIIRRILLRSDTMGTTRTLTVAAESMSNCDFRDIATAGAASPFTGSNFGDCGGNSGITFPAAKTVYWNLGGTTTNWSATAWATSSGGTPALANFPLAQDTAVIDNTGTTPTTLQIEVSWNIGTLNMSSRTSAVTVSNPGGPTFYGDFTAGTGVTFSGNTTNTFSNRTIKTFTTAGVTISFPVSVDAPGGGLQLNGNFTSGTTTATVGLQVLRGTFDAGSYNVYIPKFSSNTSNTRTINMGSGTWTLYGTATVWTTSTVAGLTLNKGTSNIVISELSTAAKTFVTGSNAFSFPKISYYDAGYILTFSDGITTDELANIPNSSATTIYFSTTSSSTIGTWSVTGSVGNLPQIRTNSAGTSATIAVTNKTTSAIDYLNIRDITCTSRDPVTFFVGTNSQNIGNNNGIAFTTTDYNIHVLTSGSSWSVPSDFNPSSNTIHLFGGGGGGANGYSTVGKTGGGGGGGGGYTRATNVALTPSGSVAITVGGGGAGGSSGAAGGTTSISGYTANGGGGGTATTGNSTGGGGGYGATYYGGNGGAGAISGTNTGGGGGGGAGGPNGTGGNGGTGYGSSTSPAGGGGGGNGGGTNGGNGTSTNGGDGGDSIVSSTTGGSGGSTGPGTSGTFGGGGGGSRGTSATTSGNGGSGVDILNSFGGGGGKGGQSSAALVGANSGLYGAGGGGGAALSSGATYSGGAGSQGAIIIVYTTGGPVAQNSNFFLLFG